jgi:D-beta-D-heptose 7-phosphate kinase/D-beta-D-heptose 1-phosphate adenosyltransferase
MTNLGKERALELLANFCNIELMVVGDIILDAYVRGTVTRVSPEAPVLVLKKTGSDYALGGAGNVARNIVSLDARARLVSAVGDDREGDVLAREAYRLGIDLHLAVIADQPTTVKTRFHAGSHHILRVDVEEKLPDDAQEAICAKVREAMNGVNGVLVSDYGKGVIGKLVADTVLQEARARKLLTLADMKPGQMRLFTGVDAVTPNLKEARQYLGIPEESTDQSIAEIAYAVRERFGVTHVFVTAAEQGIYVLSGGEGVLVPQRHKIEVADTSGCGDTAATMLMLAMLCGATPVEAAELANRAGGWVATKIGAAAPTQENVLDMW